MPRKPLAAAVAEFNASREAKTVSPDGKRPQLNPVYVADTGRVLREFSASNPALEVCDVTKDHFDPFLSAKRELRNPRPSRLGRDIVKNG